MSVQLGATAAEKETLVDEREQEYINKQIKKAYKDKDAAASRQHHEAKMQKRKAHRSPKDDKHSLVSNRTDEDNNNNNNNNNNNSNIDTENNHNTQETKHKGSAGEFIKSIIFGGLDGIITLFAIVAS
eukprot:501464_1